MAIEVYKTWVFNKKAEPTPELMSILMANEQVLQCYKTVRDVAALTNLRILIMDRQGITGKKTEIYSIPYRSIDMWSTENAGGLFDVTAELELWTKAGHFKINVNASCDIREFDRILGEAILGK
jgi:hypothetical protein